MDFGTNKNGWSGPEYSHLDREQYDKLEESIDIKLGGTWNSRLYGKNNSQIDFLVQTIWS